MENTFTTLVDAHQDLLEKGFEKNYKIINNQKMIDDDGNSYKPSQVKVVSFYRFEGASDPSDNSIIYAVKTKNGDKGTIVSSYGSDGSRKFSEFILSIKDCEDNTMLKKLQHSKDDLISAVKNHEKVLLGLVVGISIGAVIGVLLAPKKKSLADSIAQKLHDLRKDNMKYKKDLEV